MRRIIYAVALLFGVWARASTAFTFDVTQGSMHYFGGCDVTGTVVTFYWDHVGAGISYASNDAPVYIGASGGGSVVFWSSWTTLPKVFDFSGVPSGSYTLWVQGLGGTFAAGTLNWNGSSFADPEPPAPFRTLSFTITNTTDLWRWAGVFCEELPGIMQLARRVGPGETVTFQPQVDASDTKHYFAAFVDAQNSVGAEMVVNALGDGSEEVQYYRNVAPDMATASSVETASSGMGSVTAGTAYVGGATGAGQTVVSPATTPVTTTGSVDAATNAHVSEVGNSINQTAAKVGQGIQQSIQSGATMVVTGLGAKIDQLRADNGDTKSILSEIRDVLRGGEDFNQDAALSQAASAASAVGSYSGIRPSAGAPSIVGPSGSSVLNLGDLATIGDQTLSLTLGSGGIGGTDDLLRWARPMFLLALCVGFMRGVSHHLTAYTAALPTVAAQDTAIGPENIVPGVAQGKTWGTAAAAVLVIFGGAAALVVLVDSAMRYYGDGIAGITSGWELPAGDGLAWLDTMVPVVPALGLTLLGAAVPYLMAPTYLAAAAVLRFLKT